MRNSIRYILSLSTVALLVQVVGCMPSMSQTVTVSERQDKLMASIASSEKSGELTAKEAASLRKDAAKIVQRETKMESKNGGKMSYANINEIEKALNKLSNKLHKNQLAKRVTH